MSYNYSKHFATSSSSVANTTVTPRGFSVKGRIFSVHPKNSQLSYRLGHVEHNDNIVLREDGTFYVWISRREHEEARIQVLDRVELLECSEKTRLNDGTSYWVGQSVRRIAPWTEVCEDRILLGAEHIPHPLPTSGKGRPFLMYVTPQVEQLYECDPGLHRDTMWLAKNVSFKRDGGKEAPCVEVSFVQTQWTFHEELEEGTAVTVSCRMRIWDDACRQLNLTHDITAWKALMAVNPIPFLVAACVDANYKREDGVSLQALGIQWDLRCYLENSCQEIDETTLKMLLPKAQPAAATAHDEIVNVTQTLQIPPSHRFYVMTSDPSRNRSSIESLLSAKHVVCFAVTQDKKKTTTHKKQKK